MNRKLRISLAVFVVISTVALVALVIAHSRLRGALKVTFDADRGVGLQVDDVHYSGSRQGRLEWELDAGSAMRAKGSDALLLDTVSAVFYGADGKSYRMKAGRAKYVESTGEIEAEGGVTVRSARAGGRPVVLTTARLRYSTKTGKATTKERVVITVPGMNVSGKGMLFEVESDRLTVLDDVRAVIRRM